MDIHEVMNGNFNKNWRFNLGDIPQAYLVDFDDSSWRILDVPHDFCLEQGYDQNGEPCTGYSKGGIGWYRKTFITEENMADSIVNICFDGIYNNANIYVNGKHIGFHPYGYSPINYQINSVLSPVGEKNVIAVRVDHTRYADSRWYTGAGIYRDVMLRVAPKLNIPVWGTYITTPEINGKEAVVLCEISVRNHYFEDKNFALETEILDCNGNVVSASKDDFNIRQDSERVYIQKLTVKNPVLWDIDNPALYTAVTNLLLDGKIIQKYKTSFGIRSIKFDADKGFFLNGRKVLIKGVCLHHDGGLVGSAVPAGVWRRRLKKLKEGGMNAVRTAHNPPSHEFLNICDSMGIMVQEEFFDEWDNPKDKRLNCWEQHDDYISRGYHEHFQQWAKTDLQNTMRRDRNHPCIIQWSIGNEIEWTYMKNNNASAFYNPDYPQPYFWREQRRTPEQVREIIKSLPKEKYEIGQTARLLANWTREMDVTRPITANFIFPTVSHETGYSDVLDVVGYSYRAYMYDYGHKYYPDKPIMGNENYGQWHEWKSVIDREFIAGMFIWTGIMYRGEAGRGKTWPKKGSDSGYIDFAGFERHPYYMIKSLWTDEPTVHIATQTLEKSLYKLDENGEPVEKILGGWKRRKWGWHDMNSHWNYENGQLIIVEVYSNSPWVELFINGRSLGKKYLRNFEDRIYKWVVPFERGVLTAVGEGTQDEVVTAGNPVDVVVTEEKESDVTHFIAQLIDEDGNPVKHTEAEITFEITGGIFLGTDNGDVCNVQPHNLPSVITFEGRALAIAKHIDKQKCKAKVTITNFNI